jgi:hypothetical protein
MVKLPDFPSIDFSKLDINALRNVELPKFTADLPAINADKLVAAIRDAAYLTVRLGVEAFEQAQTRRNELVKVISERFGASKTRVEANLAKRDERVNAVEARVDAVVDKIEEILPVQAGAFLGQARDLTKVARKQVRGLIRTAA